MSSAFVDSGYLLYEVISAKCATFQSCTPSKQSPVQRQARESRLDKAPRNYNGTTITSRYFSGRTVTPTGPGKTESKSGCGNSNASYQSSNPLPYPTQQNPLTAQLSQILARIRCCGRLGDEREARRLYLVHGVGFPQYRSAYETGRQERWRRRITQEGRA